LRVETLAEKRKGGLRAVLSGGARLALGSLGSSNPVAAALLSVLGITSDTTTSTPSSASRMESSLQLQLGPDIADAVQSSGIGGSDALAGLASPLLQAASAVLKARGGGSL
jgi:hypothetical protein